jgi:hypothetical protein
VLYRSAEAIELPDRERTSVPETANGIGHPKPINLHAGCLGLNRAAAHVTRSVREAQKPLKDISKVCHAIIEAREKGEDIAKPIERPIQWSAFPSADLSRDRPARCFWTSKRILKSAHL